MAAEQQRNELSLDNSSILLPEDVPGAILDKKFEAATVAELKRWLRCRNASLKGKKSDLVQRCYDYECDETLRNNVVNPDGGHCLTKKTCTSETLETVSAGSLMESFPGDGWTHSLNCLPSGFGQGTIHTFVADKTERHKVAGYNMFKCAKVVDLFMNPCLIGAMHVAVKGIVQASYKATAYTTKLFMHKHFGEILKANCRCKAGVDGRCKHVAATLYQLNDYKESGLDEIPQRAQKTCTETPRVWGIPNKLEATESDFNDLEFVKFRPDKSSQHRLDAMAKRSTYNSLSPTKRKLERLDIEEFVATSRQDGDRLMWCDILEQSVTEELCDSPEDTNLRATTSNSTDSAVASTSHVTDTQATDIFDSSICDVDVSSAGLLSPPEMPAQYCNSWTQQQVIDLEVQTRQQGESAWINARKGRITASGVGEIVKMKPSTDPSRVARLIVTRSTAYSAAMTHGTMQEPAARGAYLAQMAGYQCISAGLIVDEDRPWFGCSVDGLLHNPQREVPDGVLEIKCPFAAESDSISSLIDERGSSFYLKKVNGRIMLKESQNYFYQVQTQLGITKREWCHFVVYLVRKDGENELLHQEIWFNKDIYDTIVEKCSSFYLNAVVPMIEEQANKN